MTHAWVGVEEGLVPVKELSEPVFVPRPLGYLDLRGSFLVNWAESLPKPTHEEVLAAAGDLRSRLQG